MTFRAFDLRDGEDITRTIVYTTLKGAINAGMNLCKVSDDASWERVEQTVKLKDVDKAVTGAVAADKPAEEKKESTDPVVVALKTVVDKRPDNLFCEDLTWKVICRNVLRGSNTLLTGPTGCGKSQTAFAAAKSLDKPLFYINLGATQDPRGTLIGNTHFSKDEGTYFNQSAFVEAISTEGTVIVLDELSRAHPEAWNILMTVLDPGQRYLRIDEQPGCPEVKVAEGVSFIATANIGGEYTAVRVMDRALLDRFSMIEIPFLSADQEAELIQRIYPDMTNVDASNLAEIAKITRDEVTSPTAKITTPVSTRSVLEMAGLISDGFTLREAAEVGICPLYSKEGGTGSERTFIMTAIQKFVPDGSSDNLMGIDVGIELDAAF